MCIRDSLCGDNKEYNDCYWTVGRSFVVRCYIKFFSVCYWLSAPYIYFKIADTITFFMFYIFENKSRWSLYKKKDTDLYTDPLYNKITKHCSGYCNSIVLSYGNRRVGKKGWGRELQRLKLLCALNEWEKRWGKEGLNCEHGRYLRNVFSLWCCYWNSNDVCRWRLHYYGNNHM